MEVLKLNSKTCQKVLGRAVKAIKNGQILVCPTDTVYGLICDAANKKAVAKLYQIKKRPKSKPVPIFVKDMKMAKRFAKINKKQETFLRKIWPGAVTAILRSKKGKKTISIRIPQYKLLLSLAEQQPLAESSANISGKPALTKIKEILRHFQKQKYQPDLVVDAGNLPFSKPSAVIDLTIWPPKILRP